MHDSINRPINQSITVLSLGNIRNQNKWKGLSSTALTTEGLQENESSDTMPEQVDGWCWNDIELVIQAWQHEKLETNVESWKYGKTRLRTLKYRMQICNNSAT